VIQLFLKKHKPIFAIVAVFLALIIAVAVVSSFWPKYEAQFIELGLLGKDGTAKGYYPNDNPTLNTDSQVNWYIYIHNHMANSQNITVRVKLLNSTMQAPNDTEHEPSPFASVAELPLLLPVNDTQLIPFSWSISEAISQNGSIVIKSLMLNGQTVRVDVPAVSNSSFSIVFELWVYDQSSHEYRFGWESGKGFFSASVNMWFNVSLPSG
jgi:uncharacterized membrane protein